jgi:predicted RNase H-like HicB family nuclease
VGPRRAQRRIQARPRLSPTGWGAYCPDLPGLGVAGASRNDVERLIGEATKLHVQSLREHGESVPPPTSLQLR